MSKQYQNDGRRKASFQEAFPNGVLTGGKEGKLTISFNSEEDVILQPSESAILGEGSFFNNWDVSGGVIKNIHDRYTMLLSLDKKSNAFQEVYVALNVILKPKETVAFNEEVFNVHGKNLKGLSITNDLSEEMIIQFNEDQTYTLFPLLGEN